MGGLQEGGLKLLAVLPADRLGATGLNPLARLHRYGVPQYYDETSMTTDLHSQNEVVVVNVVVSDLFDQARKEFPAFGCRGATAWQCLL